MLNRCEFFLNIWKTLQCDLIEMTCEAHDEYAAKSQFVTHFVARSLDAYSLEHTPIDTPSYRNLCDLTAGLCEDSPDLFMALFRFNPFASSQLQKMKDALNTIELQLTGPDLASAVPLRATSSSS
jgi:prephenate dehydrogenase